MRILVSTQKDDFSDDHLMFDGNLLQFEDCFFSSACRVGIEAWAADNHYFVQFEED